MKKNPATDVGAMRLLNERRVSVFGPMQTLEDTVMQFPAKPDLQLCFLNRLGWLHKYRVYFRLDL